MPKRRYKDWNFRAEIVAKYLGELDEAAQNWATHQLLFQASQYDQTIRDSFEGDPIENWYIYAEQVCNMNHQWAMAIWHAVIGEINADVRAVSPEV